MEHIIRFDIKATRYLFWRRKEWALEARVARVEGDAVGLERELSFHAAPTIAQWNEHRLTPGDPLRLAFHRTWGRRPDNVIVSVEEVKAPEVLLRWELPRGVEFKRIEDADDDAAAG